jgi:hypothetical protein
MTLDYQELAAFTIARMPALRASGNFGQASMIESSSGSAGRRQVAFSVAVGGREVSDIGGYWRIEQKDPS